VSGIGIGQYRYSHWTPLQRFYLAPYVRSTMLSQLGFTTPGRYALLTVVDRRGPRFALDADVQPVSVRTDVDTGAPLFALTREAAAAGVRTLAVAGGPYDHRRCRPFCGPGFMRIGRWVTWPGRLFWAAWACWPSGSWSPSHRTRRGRGRADMGGD